MTARWFRYLFILLVTIGLSACDSDSSKSSDPPADNQQSNDVEPPPINKSELRGIWRAASEQDGSDTVIYAFTLQANDEALYEVSRYGGDIGSASLQPGSWDLAGTTLILDSPVSQMNGHGDVVGKKQVEIKGRTFNKQ